MKIILPTPCKEKLNEVNFCAKCQHKINDFSNLNQTDLADSMQKEEVYCGIFHPSQLDRNLLQKTISNVMVFSAFGLMISTMQAQKPNTACHDNPEPKNDSVQVEKIEFKLIVNKDSKSKTDDFSTYRLLINNEIIEQNLKVGKEYIIKFDVQKDFPIDIRLASNQKNIEINKNYTSKNLPKKLKLNVADFAMEDVIMGDIAIEPRIQGIIAIKQ